MGRQADSNHRESVDQMGAPNPNPNNTDGPMRSSPLLMRVHADDQDKKTTCIFWTVLFALAFIIAILANYAIPAIFVKNNLMKSLSETSIIACQNPAGLSGTQITCSTSQSQFAEVVTGWNTVNQFSLLYMEVRPNDLSQSIKIQLNYQLQLTNLELKKDSTGVKNFYLKGSPSQLNATIDFSSSDADRLYDGQTIVGYQYLLAIVSQLDGQPFQTLIKFSQNLNTTTSIYRLQSYAINPKFTYFTIILRYVFFALAILGCVLYMIRFVKIPEKEKIIEQKMIAVISVLLIMFNDPFYPITVLNPNPASGFFSILFVVNIIAFLVLLWLVIADRIYFQDGQKQTAQFTKKKLAYVLSLWLIMLICLTVYTMKQVDGDPLVPDKFNRSYNSARVIIGLVLFAGIFYIGFRFIRSCMAPQGRTWRSYLFMAFSSVFIFAVFIIVISNSLILFNYSGSVILLVYGLINVYIYYLQYMFTITREEVDKLADPEAQIPANNNYDMITVGTIDLVDVNLDDEMVSNKMDLSYKVERKKLEEDEKQEKEGTEVEKSEFQPYGFD